METVPYNGLGGDVKWIYNRPFNEIQKNAGPLVERGPRSFQRMARANKKPRTTDVRLSSPRSRKLEVRLDVMLGAQQPRPERRHERVVAELHQHRSAT